MKIPKKSELTLQMINPVVKSNGKKTNGLSNGIKLTSSSRNFETRFIPRYSEVPVMPEGLAVPTFSESSNKILKERYLLKGGNLEAVETVAERFWKLAYDIASADFDFGASKAEVLKKAVEFYNFMVRQEFLPNSPTIMNAGKQNGLQYSACFVLPVDDSLPEIFDSVKYAALIHQTGGGCIAGDARVWTSFCGIEPIEVLFNRVVADGRIGFRQGLGVAYDVSGLDIKTVSMDPKTGQTGLQKVSHVWKYDVLAKDQVVVSTVEGIKVQTSSWHPFMVIRASKIVEVRADGLVSGDIVLGPDQPDGYWPWQEERTVGGLNINPELGWLIGFTLGDGSFGYVKALRQYRVRWFSGRLDVLEKVQEVLSKQNISVSIQKDKRGLFSVTTLNQKFVHVLLEACGLEKFGPKDNLIRVPEIIAKSPLLVIRAFLAGLIDSDGYVASYGSPSYSSASKVIVEDLAALMSLLGYYPATRSKLPYGKGRHINYIIQLCSLPQVNQLSEELRPYLSSQLRMGRLRSASRKQTALPLEFRAWRDVLSKLKLVTKRGIKEVEPLAKELSYWSAHGRINRDGLLVIAQTVKTVDPILAKFLEKVAKTGHEIKEVKQAVEPKIYYDLSVDNWNTYAAGQSGLVMIHNTGFAFSRLRPSGSPVKTSGGVASGPVSFLRVFNAATEAIKQGGTRRGANMGILRIDHPDVLEFIRCKAELDERNKTVYDGIADFLPGDDHRKYLKSLLLDNQISNFNISCAVTDKFMEAYYKGEDYELIHPKTKEVVGKLNAKEVFEEIIDRAWHTGDPGMVFIDRINNSPANPVPELEEIESTNPCVTVDTWVHTNHGPRQVRDLIGVSFLARVNGQDYLSGPEGFFKTAKKKVIKLHTAEGYSLSLTDNHLVKRLVSDDYKNMQTDWCQAGKLVPGDRLLLHNHRQNIFWRGEYNYKEGYLIGLLLGDGTLNSDKAVLSVWNSPINSNVSVPIYKEGPQSVMQFAYDSAVSMPHRSDFTGWMYLLDRNEYRLSLAAIKSLAHKLGMYPDHKTVTPEIEKTSSDFYKGFLRGFFDADGSVQLGTQGRINVRLAQSNILCLEAVQRMLLRLGILSKIYRNRRVAGKKLLPDGKGGYKEYSIKAQHELIISRDNLDQFNEVIGFANSDKSKLLTKLLKSHSKTGRYNERFVSVVKNVKIEAESDVYDVKIPGINAFDANGIIAHNCGEQPLAPWDACNLGSINLGKFVLADGTGVDWIRLKEATHKAAHFLDNVVQTNPYTLREIYDEVHRNRRIGLGVMGWADMLFKLKIAYNSDEAIELGEQVMEFINNEGHQESEALAEVRGAFPNWAHSIYSSGKPLRNSTVSTIAPTGTISIIGDCSSGIEPVFALAYLHKAKGVGNQMRVLTIANQTFTEIAKRDGFYSDDLAAKVMEAGSVALVDDVPADWKSVFITAPEISPEWHVKMQAAFQKNTDNGVSKTINLPNSATVDDVKTAYLMAWETGCKGITVYRDGAKTVQVLNVSSVQHGLKKQEVASEVVAEEVPSASQDSFVHRPMILRGRTYKLQTPVGEGFITINRDEKDEPFEVFVTIGKGGTHTLADAEAIGRLVTLSLRLSRTANSSPLGVAEKIVAQLRGIGGASHIGFGKDRIMSLADAIAKALAEDLAVSSSEKQAEVVPLSLLETQTSGSKLSSNMDLCPECGDYSLALEEGCQKCYSCGFSKC